MLKKQIPIDEVKLREIVKQYGTPFHIYIEKDIRANARKLLEAFSWAPSFKEYFAVKALPNPYILKLLKEEGFGADCSSYPELVLSQKVGLSGHDICFTSNNTPAQEFVKARELGAVINLDDITHIEFLEEVAGLPEILSFRYNPGPLRKSGNAIIGYPEEAKYGMTKEHIIQAIKILLAKGVTRFGLHTMVVSNELNVNHLWETAEMMFDLAVQIKKKTGVIPEFINLGGGIGIPYKPEQKPVDLREFGDGVRRLYEKIMKPAGMDKVKICLESGRMITGPYGYLVTRAIHHKDIYKKYIGVDACMADLMRPALYGAYHHITVLGKEDAPLDHVYDVTGSLCENNDKFAVDRALPEISEGDILILHDSGAHGYAMGFNYNGKLRSKELLYKENGEVQQIRRAETIDDLFATLDMDNL
ncbi:MAG: diaminopimelate decarboxylase family protein [Bacillota bacterium]|jgi:diaminopimelate decarboxylase